ncbi:MAG: hypothetical protein EOM50_15690 [Erysipelotrichia bacterium]|nr:hypothetical protein [Erysipelotrichia bacterium]
MNNNIEIFSVFDIFKNILTIIPPTIVLAALLMYIRTGSMFIVLGKVWSFFASKDNIKNEQINDFNQEMLETTNFRFIYGINVTGVEDIKSIHRLKNRFEIPIGVLLSAKRYIFSNSDRILKKPSPYIKNINLFLALVSIFILASSTIIGLAQNVIIRMNDSRNYYSIDESKITKLLFNDTLTIKDTCKGEVLKSNDDIGKICKFSENKTEFKEFINENLSAQKKIGIIFFIIGLYLYISAIRASIAFKSAIKICESIKKHYYH